MPERAELLQGTLDLLILKSLILGPLHGWGISKRLRQMSEDIFEVGQGSLYPALYRLEERGLIAASWGISEEGRRHLEENRVAADALLSQLDRIGRRMGDVRRAFAGDPDEAGEEGDTHELRQARRELRRVLRERKRGSPEESRRIADILRRATADILGRS